MKQSSVVTFTRAATALALASVLALRATGAGAAEPVAEKGTRCAGIANDATRLACYDADFRTPLAPEKTFGIERRLSRETETLESLHGRITSVQSLGDGALRVTLDNGQVWQQLDKKGQARWAVGDELVIDRAAFGSFMAAEAGSKRAFRVRREK
jgi:hypothetical protein